ncbi:MAG: UDP-3-O-acyl-N-acetylglucosamine deacetylase [Thermodesulfobacteriota bacterium]
MFEQTLGDIISFSGVGLHCGRDINVCVFPASAGSGITFVRTDLPGSPRVRASAESVVATSYATSLGAAGVTVSTVEHMLAAFYSLGVDNAIVELDGPEVPILDGSAAEFVDMIDAVGVTDLDASKKYLVVRKPIRVEEDGKYILLMPVDDWEFSVDYSIDFAHPFLAEQTFRGHFSRDVFRREVGRARTFGFLRDVETLRANGLAKGGSLNNAVVIGEREILNEGGLRYPDEFVRHKVLDLMGDISLVGVPIIGHIIAHRSGHDLNNRLVKKVLRESGSWELIEELPRRGRRHAAPFSESLAVV